jgi:uncharacterized surface protein with fasciclin (FAS1) repeats
VRRRLSVAAAAVLALAVSTTLLAPSAGATAARHRTPPPTITDIVARSGGDFDGNHADYDLLLNAVITAGLAETLATPGLNVTVWAPNDRAFIRLANDLGYAGSDEAGAFGAIVATLTTLGGGDPLPLLTQVLTYHVTPGARGVFQVLFTPSFPTLQGATIGRNFSSFWTLLELVDHEPGLRNPNITWPLQVWASNGIIHTIDRVLIPVDLDAVPNP